MSEIYYLISDSDGVCVPLTDNKGSPPWWETPDVVWRLFFQAINGDISKCRVITDTQIDELESQVTDVASDFYDWT